MSEDLTNLRNPLNERADEETRNEAKVTPIPPSAVADDLFDDSIEPTDELRNPRDHEPRQGA